MQSKPLYKPFPYKGSGRYKMSVYVKGANGNRKLIHFGHKSYQDFTQHKDPKRRTAYLKRAKGIRKKDGTLSYKDKNSANYWAIKTLWAG